MNFEIITDIDSFKKLEPEYSELLAKNSGKTLYVTHEYMYSWLQSLRGKKHFQILVAREGTKLKGVFLSSEKSSSILNPKKLIRLGLLAGDGLWGYSDIVCSLEDRVSFFNEVLNFLSTGRFGDFFDLGPLIGDSDSVSIYESILRERRIPYTKMELEGAPFVNAFSTLADFDATLSGRKSVTSDLRRCRKKLEALGSLSCFRVPDCSSRQEIKKWSDTFFQMYNKQWEKSRFKSRPEFMSFYENFAFLASQKGFLDFRFLLLGERPIAAHYGFIKDKSLYYFTPTYDVELQKYSPGKLLLREMLEMAIDSRLEFDFQNGMDPYKFEWTQTYRTRVLIRIACTWKGRLVRKLVK
jgi:CelD/BcsL family acetyltransferase involved in cellulose biosynthesis